MHEDQQTLGRAFGGKQIHLFARACAIGDFAYPAFELRPKIGGARQPELRIAVAVFDMGRVGKGILPINPALIVHDASRWFCASRAASAHKGLILRAAAGLANLRGKSNLLV